MLFVRKKSQKSWDGAVAVVVLLVCQVSLSFGCSGARSTLMEPLMLDAGTNDFRDAAGLTPCGSKTESCDVTSLGGETCASRGLGAGQLACNVADCTFDTSQCEHQPAGGNVLTENDNGDPLGYMGDAGEDETQPEPGTDGDPEQADTDTENMGAAGEGGGGE